MKKLLTTALCIALALMQCASALAGVSLPSGLTVIESEAFEGDQSIGGVVQIPSSVRRIGDEAFKDTSVYAMWMPNGIEYIGSNVLQNTDAVYAVVPKPSVNFGADALTGVDYILTQADGNVQAWAEDKGIPCYTFYEYNWYDGFCYNYSYDTMEAKLLFPRSGNVSGSVTIPAYMDGFLVTEIGSHAFTRLSGVTEINVPETAALSETRVNWPNATINVYKVGADAEVPEGAEQIPMAEGYKVLNIGDEYWPWFNEIPAGEQGWTWRSSNESVVTVNQDGCVEAVGLGSATVTALIDCGENGMYYGTCDIEVKKPRIEVTVLEDVITIPVGRVTQVTYNFTADGLTENVQIDITSSDPSIVTHDDNGFVGVAPGRAVVTCTATLGDVSDSKTVIIEVYEPSLKLNHVSLYAYSSFEYKMELLTEVPETAKVAWSSENEHIATIDQEGNVSVHEGGNAKIFCTVTYEDGTVATADCNLVVRSWYLEWEELFEVQSMMVGETRHLRPVLWMSMWPAELEAVQITMTSSDDSIVSYEDNVNATAHRTGMVTVTARAEVLGRSAETTFRIAVSDESVTTVTMNYPELKMNPGDVTYLWPEAELPEDCEHFWEWTSSNEAVAAVRDGEVVAGELGDATIDVTVTCGENGEYGVFHAQSLVQVKEPKVTITMEETEITVPVGRFVDFDFEYEVDGLEENVNFRFVSEDPAIVDPETQIAVGAGTTTTAYVLELHGVEARVELIVHVYQPELSLNYATRYTFTGFEEQLTVEDELPEDAVVEWRSTDESVFTIDNTGLLTAHNEGEAYAECYVHYADGTVKSADCRVYVYSWLLEWNYHGEFADPQCLTVGETCPASPGLWFMVSPQHEAATIVTSFTSSDESIVSIDEKRQLIAHKEGTVTIECHAEYYGRTADYSYTAIVQAPYLDVRVDNSYEEMQVGDDNRWVNVWEETSMPITRRVYESSDETVVKVGSNGLLTPVGAGEATVTYTIYVGEYSASAQMTVVVFGQTATLTPGEVTLKKGESTMLAPEVANGEINYHNRQFYSSNDAVAMVNGEGLVTALSAGTAVIYFESEWDGYRIKAESVVHVVDTEAKIRLNTASIKLNLGESYQLEAAISGEAENVYWSVSNPDALRVDANGLVTLHNWWNASNAEYVYCTANVDGVLESASCMVQGDLTGLTINMSRTMSMNVHDEFGLWFDIRANDQNLAYTTEFVVDNEDVISISQRSGECIVYALAEGMATVTLKVYGTDGALLGSRTCMVYVGEEKPTITEAYFRDEFFLLSTEGNDGWEHWADVIVTPNELLDIYGFWVESSDENIVRVDERHLLRGVNPGKATITLHVDEHPELTDTATVYVTNLSFTVDREVTEDRRVEMQKDETITFALEGIPADYPAFEVFWNYDSYMLSEVSRTDRSITLRARASGDTWMDCNVDMYANNGCWNNFNLIISGEENNYWLNWRNANMVPGDEIGVWPEFGCQSVIWSSTNGDVAVVDENGNVRAVGMGQCEIIAACIADDGSAVTAMMDVTVCEREWKLVHMDNIPATMVKGYVYDMDPHIVHTGVNRPACTWEISNPDLGYFDDDGRFHAEKVGTFTVTITASENGQVEALSRQITITEPAARMEMDYFTLRPNQSRTMNLVIAEGKEVASVAWRSANENMVQVDENGTITAIGSEGRTMIVAEVTFVDGTKINAVAYMDLIPDWDVYWHGWSNSDFEEFNVGENRELWVYYDTNAAPDEIAFTWWADDAEALTFTPVTDEEGNVHNESARLEALKETDTWVHCRIEVGPEGSLRTEEFHYHVITHQPYFEINPDPMEYQVRVGDVQGINWNARWDFMDVRNWTTISSDESIATVTRDEGIRGVAPGTATITRTYYGPDGVVYGSASIQVTVNGAKVTLDQTEVTLQAGETLKLNHTVELNGLDDHGFCWWSDDESVAQVTQDGTVYAAGYGAVRVGYTHYTNEGEFKATCIVNVTADAPEFGLNFAYVTLYDRQVLPLEIVTNLGAPDSVTWESTNGEVQVDENGMVRVYANGNENIVARVFCHATYGETTYTASCQIVVPTPTFGISNWNFGDGHWMGLGVGEEHYRSEGIWKLDGSTELVTEYWSDDDGIATIAQDGDGCIIYGVAVGETTLHYRLVNLETGEGYVWDMHVRVGIDNPPLTKVEPIHRLIVVDREYGNHIALDIQPSYTPWEVRYTSQDESIAGVNPDGFVFGVNPGRTMIDVEVVNQPELNFSVEVLVLGELTISAADGRTTFKPGESVQLVLNGATWTEDDECYLNWYQHHGDVNLDQNGLLSIGMRGDDTLDAWLDVHFPNGYFRNVEFRYNITNSDPFMFICTNEGARNPKVYEGVRLEMVIHSNAWENVQRSSMVSDNTEIATIEQDENGTWFVNCVGQGEATIMYTMTLNDGTVLMSSMLLTVTEIQAPVVRCTPGSYLLHVGETVPTFLEYTNGPFDFCPEHYYTSSDETILSCAYPTEEWPDFTITGVAPGKVELTVHANYGDLTAEHTVTVVVIE